MVRYREEYREGEGGEEQQRKNGGENREQRNIYGVLKRRN